MALSPARTAPAVAGGPAATARRLAWIVALAVVYAALGLLSLRWYPLGVDMAALWPGAGVGLAAAMIAGPTMAAGVLAGDLLVSLHAGAGVLAAGISALGNAGETLLAWYLLSRVRPIDLRLARVRDVVAFLGLGVVLTTVLCIAGRSLNAALTDASDAASVPPSVLVVAWLGHALGVLVVTPAIITWRTGGALSSRRGEFLLLGAAAAACLALVAAGVSARGVPLLYAAFPLVVWAALRFGPREVAMLLLASGPIFVWSSQDAGGAAPESLLPISLFMLVLCASGLLLVAALAERAAAARRVADNERFHRALLDQMAEGVVLLDARGVLTHVSDRFCAIVATSRDALVGRRFGELLAETDRAPFEAALASCSRGLGPRTEVTLLRPGGGILAVSVAPRPLHDAATGPAILAVVSDVTERRRAEEQARLHLQQLAHLGRLKALDEMAGAITHEITQPLTAIAGYAQAARRLLAAGRSDAPELAEALAGIERGARHAGELVRRIRGFARNHAACPVAVEPGYLIGEIARLAEPVARQCGVTLFADSSLRAPQVWADPIQVQQVLLNLAHNAIEALAEARVARRELRISAHARGERELEFRVADTGPGIAPADLARIFEPFFSTKEQGVGIGLAISRSIADAHGGTLAVESAAGRGATFRLVLPAYPHGNDILHA